jgi:hypothetical protein
MSKYLEGLGSDATVKGVFDDLYGRADSIIQELERMRIDAHGEGTNINYLPNLPIRFGWASGTDGAEGSVSSTTIIADPGFSRNPLLATSRHRPHRDVAPEPIGVQAYRGNEIGGDYRLSRLINTTGIECRLGELGLRGTSKRRSGR